MADTVLRILEIFKSNNIQAGGALNKRVVLDEIKSWGLDMNEVRDSWHRLIGEGLLEQEGDDLSLTRKGAGRIYG